jgi:phage terminase large subunit GpA-like protein
VDIEDWLGGPGEGRSGVNLSRDYVVPTHRDGWESLLESVTEATAKTLKPRVRMTVTEWAEATAIIPATSGQPKPGPYRAFNGPVMRTPQDAFSNPLCSEITMVIAAQVGKSRALWNMGGWAIEIAPGPITAIYPDEATAQTKMEEDFLPGIWATPSLSANVSPDEKLGQRDKGRKLRFTFDGGWYRFVSARSAAGVKGSPAQYIIIDEHAAAVIGAPINPDGLAGPRQTQLANTKMVRASTPFGSEETCPTIAQYRLSDMRKCFVSCPKCSTEFLMDWDHASAGNVPGKPRHFGSYYVCHNAQCQHRIYDGERGGMLDRCRWKQTAIHECCGKEHDPMVTKSWDEDGIHRCPDCFAPRDQTHQGYRCSTLYAKGVELDKLMKRWFDAQGNPSLLQEFKNQTLAEGFEPAGSFTRDIIKVIQDRRLDVQEIWGPNVVVPGGARFVVMPVDVQRDRLEMDLRAYGAGEESWGLGMLRIWGDPNAPDADVWKKLHHIRKGGRDGLQMPGVDGRYFMATLCGIDTGDPVTRASAYRYINANRGDGVVALRGERDGKLYQKFDPTKHKHEYPHDVIGTDAAKELLDMRLQIKWIDQDGPHIIKPGMIHWPRYGFEMEMDPETGEQAVLGYDDEYYDQVTNFQQKFMRDRRSGQRKLAFDAADKSVREEGLDMMNYANGLCQAVMKRFNVGFVDHVPEQWFLSTDIQRRKAMAERGSVPIALTEDEAAVLAVESRAGRKWKHVRRPHVPQPGADAVTTGAEAGFHVSRPGSRRGGF